jgi:hypothetical protein
VNIVVPWPDPLLLGRAAEIVASATVIARLEITGERR